MVKFDITKYDVATPKGLSETIAAILDNKKGKQVTTIDLSDKTVVADYFVIASAYSSTAVKALADAVEEELDKVGVHPLHRDADQKWIALDYGSVIVHVILQGTPRFLQPRTALGGRRQRYRNGRGGIEKERTRSKNV